MLLSDPLSDHFRLAGTQVRALEKLQIRSVRDLLFHFPSRYETGGSESSIGGLALGQEATVIGVLEKLEIRKSWKRKIPVAEGRIRDESGSIKVMWFHQPYLAKKFAEGTPVKAVGKITGTSGKLYLANPAVERIDPTSYHPVQTKRDGDEKIFAVYPESRGVTSLWVRHALERLFAGGALEKIEDPIPEEMRTRYHLPSLKAALQWIHTPKDLKNAEAARKRFAFEEVFFIQLLMQKERALEAKEKGFVVRTDKDFIAPFMEAFPFSATNAQHRAIEAILADMSKGAPMSRLLEGDVGSGKTAVAATAAYAVAHSRPSGKDFGNLQVAYMAPTEILAKQHFESFIKYFENFPLPIGLITGSGCKKFPSKVNREKATDISRSQFLKWVKNGEIPIVIGTHALIQKSVEFKHLALVIIDEQHRFGTMQRKKLARKDVAIPHLLSMTATPIPRTLALTIYGDLDLTLLDEMPPGRKTIITDILTPNERERAYAKMREELKAGRQAYVICPRIDEPDPTKLLALNAKSVKEEAKRLAKDIFPEYRIEILHSKMKPKEKDEVMGRFARHETDILVATSVVEVGVNVPNATLILIEGAERFGLSQLHQLRGRVLRSTHQSYCFALPESRGDKTRERLQALKTAKNGFELAEMDLMQRGPGELYGRSQWGISDVGMEALKNLKLVEAARTEAHKLIEEDPELTKHPLLLERVHERASALHFE